jgi:hypothetical protein
VNQLLSVACVTKDPRDDPKYFVSEMAMIFRVECHKSMNITTTVSET